MTGALQLPALLLSVLLASVYAAVFSLWQAEGVRDLLAFWLASVTGFACGQMAGQALDVVPWTVGQVHLLEATGGALLFLFIVRWLKPKGKAS